MVVLRESGVDLASMEAIAQRFGHALCPGDLVLLVGPLGAGKTEFVRMVAAPLGLQDPVRSPSFTIANIYEGSAPNGERVTVNHLDLYRLDSIEDEDALALEEYLCGSAITLVEWPQAGREKLGGPQWVIRLDHESLTTRSITIDAAGPGEVARWEAAR